MIKGTTKKAKENARKLVDSMIDLTGYDNIQTTDKHAAIRDICAAEMGREWSIDTFKEWCYGLPSAFDSAVFLYNGTPWDALSRLYENTPEESERFRARVPYEVAADRFLYICFRELNKQNHGYC